MLSTGVGRLRGLTVLAALGAATMSLGSVVPAAPSRGQRSVGTTPRRSGLTAEQIAWNKAVDEKKAAKKAVKRANARLASTPTEQLEKGN